MAWEFTLTIDLPWLLGLLGAGALAGYWVFKRKLHGLREFVVHLDDALYDDKVTEDEYRIIWESFKTLVGKKAEEEPDGGDSN